MVWTQHRSAGSDQNKSVNTGNEKNKNRKADGQRPPDAQDRELWLESALCALGVKRGLPWR
eukprot:2615830-Prorocentrum_lima.AAC.1